MALSTTLMKNCEVAESGTDVRAIATVPRMLLKPLRLSSGMVGRVAFCFMSASKPPPWIMKSSMTRWKISPS